MNITLKHGEKLNKSCKWGDRSYLSQKQHYHIVDNRMFETTRNKNMKLNHKSRTLYIEWYKYNYLCTIALFVNPLKISQIVKNW